MQKKTKKKKTLKKNSSPKKRAKNSTLLYFFLRHKLLSFIIIAVCVSFIALRKDDIIYTIKDETVKAINTPPPEKEIKYSKPESVYLKELKTKYSGYGRYVSIADTKKAIEDACNYIANIEGYTFWNSNNAKDLLLATAVAESDLRARYSQHGGNAVGIFQIEYITFKDIWHRSLAKKYPKLYQAMLRDFGNIDFEMLQNNDMLAAIFARLVYSRAKTRIPYRNDVKEQALYYKKYYNTHLGKAKTDTFIKKKTNMHKLK